MGGSGDSGAVADRHIIQRRIISIVDGNGSEEEIHRSENHGHYEELCGTADFEKMIANAKQTGTIVSESHLHVLRAWAEMVLHETGED